MRKLAPILIAAAVLAVPSGASAAQTCPSKPNTLAKDSTGRVWHKGASLYACTTVYGHKPRTFRMGPYTQWTKVAFDGVNVAWSTVITRNGVRSDRVWAGSADTGKRWMEGKRLLAATGDLPEREARMKRVVLADRAVAWVTKAGDVGMALQFPEDAPKKLGALPGTPTPAGQRLLVGSFGTAAAATIAREFELEQKPGDGDECGGSNPYTLTFRTEPHAPLVGVEWQGGWVSTNCS